MVKTPLYVSGYLLSSFKLILDNFKHTTVGANFLLSFQLK